MADIDTATLNQTINATCAHLRNFFVIPAQKMTGQFDLAKGSIILPLDLKVGQRLYIEPSRTEHQEASGSYRIASKLPANTGGFLYGLDGLGETTDTWCGTLYGQAVPLDFIEVCKKIIAWEAKNVPSNLVSESVSGFYSKTLATGEDGLPANALAVFKKGLQRWRRNVTGVRH